MLLRPAKCSKIKTALEQIQGQSIYSENKMDFDVHLRSWRLIEQDEAMPDTYERKVLWKIFGPIKENKTWWIKTNQEMMTLFNKPSRNRRDQKQEK